jgi:eukaryotic-like serine/threonine-protein kinase
MNSVTLTVIKGNLPRKVYRFEGREHLIVGRMDDCAIQVPNDDDNRLVSRYHCHIDITPPYAALCDYGSRNGTYLNEALIGKREEGESAEEGRRRKYPEKLLQDGDIIRLADAITLKVSIEREARAGKDIFATSGKGSDGIEALEEAYKTRKAEALVPDHVQKVLKDYQILKEIGDGGFGKVYLAIHKKSGEKRAIKLMIPEIIYSSNADKEFQREIAVSEQLQHKNIVRLYEHFKEDDCYALVMDYCDGGDVHRKMNAERRLLTPREAVGITIQLLDALAYAHALPVKLPIADGSVRPAKGVVHRDIKPSNILLDGPELRVKLADFGLAKAFDLAGMSGLSRSGMGKGYAAGTLPFMSRVQCVEFKYSKPDVDLWATAASLYFMLTREPPRQFDKRTDPYDTILYSDPVPIRQRRPEIPAKLAEVIDAALIDKPEIRTRSADELKRALENVAL